MLAEKRKERQMVPLISNLHYNYFIGYLYIYTVLDELCDKQQKYLR